VTDKTRVLAIFSHRPDKVSRVLPHSDLEYKVIEKHSFWRGLPSYLRLLLLIPSTLWTLLPSLSGIKSRRRIRSFNPDIVFTHGGAMSYRDCITAKALGKKLAVRLGGHVYDELRENLASQGIEKILTESTYKTHYWFMFANLRAADRVIVVTQEMKDRFCRESRRDPDTVSVVPVPIDIGRFDKPKIPHLSYRVLSIINLNFGSKLRAMLDFLPVLERYRATIIAPGRYRNSLSRQTYLPILGYTANIEEQYRQADVLCYFSYLDGCPNVILEAWASHTPVIANRCPWSEELVQHGKTGLLADNPKQAAGFVRTLMRDTEMADRLVKAGYKYLTTHHSEQVVGQRLGEVLRGAV